MFEVTSRSVPTIPEISVANRYMIYVLFTGVKLWKLLNIRARSCYNIATCSNLVTDMPTFYVRHLVLQL